jgi:hypothetical protein
VRFATAADLVMTLETAQRQGRWKETMHRAVSVYKLLIMPLAREQANLSSRWSPSAMRRAP